MEILNQSCSTISITSPVLVEVLVEPSDSLVIKVSVVLNCCSDAYSEDIEPTDLSTDTYEIVGTTLYLKPAFFSKETIDNGIYSVKIVAITESETLSDSNCTFIDCDFKCRMSEKINDLLVKDDTATKSEAIYYCMLHHALVTSSNCGCNCESLCDAYRQLYKLTYGEDLYPVYKSVSSTNQISSCGC